MAHKITSRDTVYLANLPELFAGLGWHGLGTPTVDFTAPNLSKVLWAHEMAPAGIQTPNGFVATGERYAVSKDDGLPIGQAVGKNWASPSNLELFELFSEATAGSNYKICSVLTVDGREQFAIDAKGDNIKAGSRDWAPYVGLHRFFGGKGKLLVKGHGKVMQCGNTTALFVSSVGDAESVISCKQTGAIFAKLPLIKAQIEKQHGVSAMFAAAMAEAESVTVKTETAARAFVGLLTEGKALSTRSVNRSNRLVQLFKSGAGNRGENLADVFNALTDFYTHESAGSVDSAESKEDFLVKQWHASEFGGAATRKSELAEMFFDAKEGKPRNGVVAHLAKMGRASIEASEAETVAELVLN
jgi:hypothetical protein